MSSSTSRSSHSIEPTPRRRNHVQQVNIDFGEEGNIDEDQTMGADDGPDSPHTRFSLGVSECIETKTTTITTRTTRKFPQVFSRNPVPLRSLDNKEYPLAAKPTPLELTNISYSMLAEEDKIGRSTTVIEEADELEQTQQGTSRPRGKHARLGADDQPKSSRYTRSTASPSDGSRTDPHQYSQASQRAASPISIAGNNVSAQRPRSLRSTGLGDISRRFKKMISHGVATAAPSSTSRSGAGFLITPDTSEIQEHEFPSHVEGKRKAQNTSSDAVAHMPEPASAGQPSASYAATSPAGSDSQTIYSGSVATPPITDSDLGPFADDDLSERLIQAASRPVINVAAAQDASLPSPRLSPTLAATQPDTMVDVEEGDKINNDPPESNGDSQTAVGFGDGASFKFEPDWKDSAFTKNQSKTHRAPHQDGASVFVDTKNLLDIFDSMKPQMKSYMMYQFLRRCPRPTLRVIAGAVNPVLKCDFLSQLPLELSYLVLSYLDCRDLCRAAQTSKHWRNIIDRNETGWKELFDREGFTLASGELEKSVIQGWGWQDPVGATGFEQDLSRHSRLTQSDADLTRNFKPPAEVVALRRQTKRKRTAFAVSERSKRRISITDLVSGTRDQQRLQEPRQHKSEGPLSAANAAVLAVPDPGLGLPSLRQIHLYKSLYRRHHMIRNNWTSGAVKPKHVAFAAHPRHVITCLQFDDDKIITGSDDTLIHIYDTKTGKLRKKLEGHEGGVWALQYEGNILVSGSTDRSVRVWDIERGLCQQVFYGHTSTVRCLQILMPTEIKGDDGKIITRPEKPLIITGSRDSQLRVWRLPEVGSRRYIQTGPPAHESDCPYFIRTLLGHTHSVRAIAAHGDTLVSGSYDSTVRVWKISTGDVQHVLAGHNQKVYSVVLDVERNRCISGSMDSLVKIWDLETGACLYTLEGHSLLVGLLDLHDDRLVSAAADSTLRIWDPENGRCRNTLIAHTGAITCFQHDARKVISGSEKMVKMWDVKTGECIQDLLTELSGMWQVKFDGRRCIAAVQRDSLTYVEILDFGAVRDGEPVENLGKRILLNEPEVRAIIEEEA